MSTPVAVVQTAPSQHFQYNRNEILTALRGLIEQRPLISRASYTSDKAYWKAAREVARDLRDAEKLLRYVHTHEDITAEELRQAFETAYDGRLVLVAREGRDTVVAAHYVGETWPEYRKAVCAGLALAIQRYYRRRHESEIKTRALLGKTFSSPNLVKRWFTENEVKQ